MLKEGRLCLSLYIKILSNNYVQQVNFLEKRLSRRPTRERTRSPISQKEGSKTTIPNARRYPYNSLGLVRSWDNGSYDN